MKNKWIICLVFVSLFCFVVVGLYAQTANVDQRIVGTWKDFSERVWIFNSNGTGSQGSTRFVYTFFSNKILIHNSGNSGTAYEFVFSRENRELFLTSPGGTTFWLNKEN